MTDLAHWRYHLEARAILRCVRHRARGESIRPVLACAPLDAVLWVANHRPLFALLVAGERREAQRASV